MNARRPRRDAFGPNRAARLANLASPPPPIPAGADWRPLAGYPGYFMDREMAVWAAITARGWRGPWRRLKVVMRGHTGTTRCVALRDESYAQRFKGLEVLHRAAWIDPPPPPLPGGPPSVATGADEDEGMEAWPPAPPPSRPAPSRSPDRPVPLPMGPPRRAVAARGDGDELAGDWPAPPALAARQPRAVVPLPAGPPRPTFPAGEAHPRAVLDAAKVARMKRLRLQGWSTGDLAREFGVARNTACYALNGTTWAGVEPEPPARGGIA